MNTPFSSSFDPAAEPVSSFPLPSIPQPEMKPFSIDSPSVGKANIDTKLIKQMIYRMKDELDVILRLVNGDTEGARDFRPHLETIAVGANIQVLEGEFTGNLMRATDGKEFPVPPNYASKSKLVEGDKMKLTITPSGAFIYKQIAQIERDRVTGELSLDPGTGQWHVVVNGKPYKVLTASVTFYRGKPGDTVSMLIPKGIEASWGAMENVLSPGATTLPTS
jgi:hypothetical protein